MFGELPGTSIVVVTVFEVWLQDGGLSSYTDQGSDMDHQMNTNNYTV